MSFFMDVMHYDGMDMPHSKSGDFSHNCLRSFPKSQRDMMRRDIMAKHGKNQRYGDYIESISRMTMDFCGRMLDSQGRIVDPRRSFFMEEHYMDNDRLPFHHDMIRSRGGMYGSLYGLNSGDNYYRGMFNDGMYRDMYHGGMQPFIPNRSIMDGMYPPGRFMDDPIFMYYRPRMCEHFIDSQNPFKDQEGGQGMFRRMSDNFGASPRRSTEGQSLTRCLSDSRGMHRRLSEDHTPTEDTNNQRKASKGMLFSEESSNMESA